MRKQLRQLIQMLLSASPSREKQGVIVLIAFFLAVTLWSLATLNQEYQSTLRYPIQIVNVPETLEVRTITPAEIEVVTKGSGIDLLSQHLRFRKDTLQFPFVSDFIEKQFAQTRAFEKVAQDQVGSNLSVISFWPDRIDLTYSLRSRKNVPLRLATNIRLKPAYQLDELPTLGVDSVTIIGPQEQLDTIHEWFTQGGSTPILSGESSIEILVSDTVAGIEVTPDVVRLDLKPRLYTQTEVPVLVQITDKPGNVEVRLSQKSIYVTCLVPFDEYKSILDQRNNFVAEVPYQRLDRNFDRIIPNISLPPRVKLIRQHPAELRYVIVRP